MSIRLTAKSLRASASRAFVFPVPPEATDASLRPADQLPNRSLTFFDHSFNTQIAETALFKSVMEWGKAEVKRKEAKSESKDALK
jgi:hypothetical protein